MTETYSIELPVQTKILAAIAGFTLCIVSIVYTINLITDLATNVEEQLLMGAIGAALEICKFIFIPLGITLIAINQWEKGLPLLVIGILLLIVSVTASLGYLSSRTNVIAQEAKESSDGYVVASYDIDTITNQITTLETAARNDAKSQHGYIRDRARTSQSEIKDLRFERSSLQDKRDLIDGESMTSAGALFSGLAKLLNSDPAVMKEKAYFVLSLLLEICALFALSVAGIAYTKENMVMVKPVIRLPDESDEDVDDYAPHRTDRPSIADSVPRMEDEARYRNIRKQVRCGALKPTTRALKNAGCSNDYSLDYLRRMAHEGLIERVGRGYQLVA